MKKSTLFYLVAVGCGLIASIMGVSYISDAKKQAKVVVATTNLPAYTQITDKDVKVISVPKQSIQSDAITKVQDVVGKYTGMSVETDDPMRQGFLLKGTTEPAGVLATKKDSNLVMISVPLQKTDLGDGIQPGDHVNLVGITKNANELDVTEITDREVIKIEQSDKNTSSGPDLWVSIPQDKSLDIQKAIVAGTIRVELLPKGEGSNSVTVSTPQNKSTDIPKAVVKGTIQVELVPKGEGN